MSKRLGAFWTQMTRSDLKKMVNDCWEHGIKQEFDGDDREFSHAPLLMCFEAQAA